ncbi:MAG: exosortase/archaeosortase family protein [Phycisphaeraceae bacterium]|nr:exosortase/archaeosortase family protein [Phycisphaeraceae bacterium]
MKLRAAARNGWRSWHLALLLVYCSAGIALTWPAWRDLFEVAVEDEESSHILLVPLVALWLAWVRRARLRNVRPTGTMIGPVLVAAGWILGAFGFNNAYQSLWQAGAVVLVAGCALTVLGTGVLFRLFPAFAVLVFLVPVPGQVRETIALPLQTATAATTQMVLEVFGVAVERSANLMIVNGREVAVAEACNGLRMVFALFLVGYAFAFALPLRAYARVLVIAFSPIAATGCNVLRLVPTVLLYAYAPQYADRFHAVSGWLMLPVAFGLLLGLISLLRWALIPVSRYTLAYQPTTA